MPSSSTIRTVFKISIRGLDRDDHDDRFVGVKFTATGQEFVATTELGDVYLGNIPEKRVSLVQKLRRPISTFTLLKVDDVTYVVVGLDDGALVKIDLESKRLTQSHRGLGVVATNMSTHPWSPRLVTAHIDSVVIWEVGAGALRPLKRLNAASYSSLVNAFFGVNGDEVVTCFADGTIVTWTFPDLNLNANIVSPSQTVAGGCQLAAISEDATTLAAIFDNSKLLVCDLTQHEIIHRLNLPSNCHYPRQLELMTLTTKPKLLIVLLTRDGHLWFLDADNDQLSSVGVSPPGTYSIFCATSVSQMLGAVTADDGSLECLNASRLTGLRQTDTAATRGRRTKRSRPPPTVPEKTDAATSSSSDVAPVPTRRRAPTDETVPLVPARVPEPSPVPAKMVASTVVPEMRKILDRFGQFPAKYRLLVWRRLLELPGNTAAYSVLARREAHPAFSDLDKSFPITDPTLADALQRNLSCLALWCPLFAEVEYLPHLVMPFVKVINVEGAEPVACFETLMTYLINWCHDWFQFYPAPPLHVLARVEQLLRLAAPALLDHLVEQRVPATIFAWPLLESSLSDVFTGDEWLRVWDHILAARNPDFLYALVVAYMVVSQNTLLRCTQLRQFSDYFSKPQPVPLDALLAQAYYIRDHVPSQLCSSERAPPPFQALTRHTYPMFVNYPPAAVRDHAQHMTKIRALESEYVDHRRTVLQLESELGTLGEQERRWKRREAILRAAESLRRQEHHFVEQRLNRQRLHLHALNNQLTERELLVLESQKRNLRREHELRKESDVARLEDDIVWKEVLRDTEFREAEEEALARNLRQQIDRCQLEVQLLEREAETAGQFVEGVSLGAQIADEERDPGVNRSVVEVVERSRKESPRRRRRLPEKCDGRVTVVAPASLPPSRDCHSDLDEKVTRLAASNKNLEQEMKELFEKLKTFKE